MSVERLSISSIWYAIQAVRSEADRLSWNARGWEERDRAEGLKITARQAAEEYDLLSKNWDQIKRLAAASAREYDAFVTRDRFEDEGGCSCHISPPCGWCIRQSEGEQS